ncbi:hypothetical protein [Stenotrophomonas sp. AB1(2024)]|jgi:hypothetical protein
MSRAPGASKPIATAADGDAARQIDAKVAVLDISRDADPDNAARAR